MSDRSWDDSDSWTGRQKMGNKKCLQSQPQKVEATPVRKGGPVTRSVTQQVNSTN